MDGQIDEQTANMQSDCQIDGQKERNTDRQKDSLTMRNAGKQKGRQIAEKSVG